jgi:hypothetical protein
VALRKSQGLNPAFESWLAAYRSQLDEVRGWRAQH